MIKKNKKSQMTMNKLADLTKAGFGNINKKIDHIEDLVDKLAVSTLRSFENADKKIDVKVEELKDQIQGVGKRIDDFAETKVSKIIYRELENRVQK